MAKIKINVLNANRELVEIFKVYISVLWTKKFNDKGGGCVLTIPATNEVFNLLRNEAVYFSRDDDDMVCEIKKIRLTQDVDTGEDIFIITALSIDCILNQRIVWELTSYTTEAEIYARRLILDACMTEGDRKIDFIKLGKINGYTDVITKQVTHDYVDDAVIDICKTYGYGFKFVMDEDKNFVFQIYKGKDCSVNQDENSYVVFSKNYNNLNSFEWEIDFSEFKNVVLVGGEGEGTARKTATVGVAKGKDRYEMFVDAKSLSSEEGAITDYNEVMQESGVEALSTQQVKEAFSCAVDVETYEYKKDYDLGYKVTVIGKYGISFDTTIKEVIECEDDDGYRVTVQLEM